MSNNSFPKSEKLCSTKSIESLFKKRDAVFVYPFRAVWEQKSEGVDSQFSILFSVPKRKFKKAVDRNRMKRLMRESYRSNKGILSNQLTLPYNIALLYIANEKYEFQYVEKKLIAILDKLSSELLEHENSKQTP